jgi:ABC-type glycerol-3-phosphate transport system permease component
MKKIGMILIYAFLWVWVVLMLAPLLYMLLTSFKSDQEILNSPWTLPHKPDFGNYIGAWFGKGLTDITLGTNFLNSIVITVSTLVFLTLLSTLAGYALGRHQFPGSKFLYIAIIGLIAVPVHGLLVPIWNFMDQMAMLNNRLAISLIYTAFSLPFSIVIMRSYFESIPTAMEEAARIDGCKEIGVFWHIGLPMAKGAVSTVIIINVVNIWSELLFATVLLTKPEVRTLPLAISLFSQNMYSTSFGMLFAGLTMATLPLLVMYFFFQKRIVKGMAMGALK